MSPLTTSAPNVGTQETFVLCYDSSASCVDVTCDGGEWPQEVSWEITDVNGDVLISGGSTQTNNESPLTGSKLM